jgi:hypothetical protein
VLLAIDPGADAGWARFQGKTLCACGLNVHALTQGVTRVVIERPHSGKTKARLKDVLTLAIRAGEWGGRCKETLGVAAEYYEPAQWKGSLAKDICNARIWAALKPDEQAILAKAGEGVAPSKRHNICDAVGIGLWVNGRFGLGAPSP